MAGLQKEDSSIEACEGTLSLGERIHAADPGRFGMSRVGLGQALQVVRLHFNVVIDEQHDVTLSLADGQHAPVNQPMRSGVVKASKSVSMRQGQLAKWSGVERRVAVIDDEDFHGNLRRFGSSEGCHAPEKIARAMARADGDGDHDRAPRRALDQRETTMVPTVTVSWVSP